MASNAASSYMYVISCMNSLYSICSTLKLMRRTYTPLTLYLFKLPLKALRYLDLVLIEMHMPFLCLSPFLLQSRSCVYIHDRNKTLEMLM